MLTIRPATFDDALDILEWRNDPQSRAMSRDSDVIAQEDHLRWFEASLGRDNRRFFIGEFEGVKVGMMRFDRLHGDDWEVSHNMAPASRGRGLGQQMVNAVLGAFVVPTIFAEIRQDNPACWRIYERAGFRLVRSDETNRHYQLDR